MAKFFKYVNDKLEECVKMIKEDDFKPYSIEDFKCKCGCGQTISPRDPWVDFMNYLHKQTGNYYKINSGFRCHNHNQKMNGIDYVDKNGTHIISDHCVGLAADIATPNLVTRGEVVYHAFKFGIPRAIVYVEKKFVHLSTNYTKTVPLILWNEEIWTLILVKN